MIDFGMWGFEFLVIGDAGFVNGGRSGFHVCTFFFVLFDFDSYNCLKSYFKIVNYFSFSMLLHGLTLGENDGDLEVCDACFIFIPFILIFPC